MHNLQVKFSHVLWTAVYLLELPNSCSLVPSKPAWTLLGRASSQNSRESILGAQNVVCYTYSRF